MWNFRETISSPLGAAAVVLLSPQHCVVICVDVSHAPGDNNPPVFQSKIQIYEIYREDITRWREHMKFIFEWKKYFPREHSARVKSFFNEKINFIIMFKPTYNFLFIT